MLFADTLMEDEDLYRFNSDIEKLLGIKLTIIADGRTPWQVFEDVKFIGNSRIDPCSKHLKRDLIKKWIHTNYLPEACVLWVGIDCSEEHRLEAVVQNNLPYQYRSILIENNIFIDTEYKMDWCFDNGIEPPRLYAMGFTHNNCGGFCVKAGLAHFKKLYEKLPERYKEHEEKELELILTNPNLRPFLKKTVNKTVRYLTLKQYREEFLEKEKANDFEDKYEFGGCGCAL